MACINRCSMLFLAVLMLLLNYSNSIEIAKKFKLIPEIEKIKAQLLEKVQANAKKSMLVEWQSLTDGFLQSPNGEYIASLQEDGNFLVSCAGGSPIWSTSTNGTDLKLTLESNGNLVIYDNLMREKWSTGTKGKGKGPYQVVLQDDGNLVLLGNSIPLWQSNSSMKCPRTLCFQVSDLDSSGTSDSIEVEYGKDSVGKFKCNSVKGAAPGARVCCSAYYVGNYSSSGYSWMTGTPREYMVIKKKGNDGLRITEISVNGEKLDKFYNAGWNTKMMDDSLFGTCWRRFWLDGGVHGSCNQVGILLNKEYYHSTEGDCAYIACQE